MRPCRPDVPLKLLRWKGLAGGGESGRMGPISERDHRTPDFDARRLMWMPSFGQRSQAVKRISIIMLIIGSVPPALRGCPDVLLSEGDYLWWTCDCLEGNPTSVQVAFANSTSAALVSSGRSCWIQCPAPGTSSKRRRFGISARIVSSSVGVWWEEITGSWSPARNRAGGVIWAASHGAVSAQL